jgi:fumarate reductase subunit C
MDSTQHVIAGVGLADRPRKSRWPARMDFAQSATGLVLGLFMWGHMFFVSSILLGKDAMWSITKMFEGYFFFGKAYPGIVSVVVAVIFAFVIVHAFLAMRKFPANYQQYRTFVGHRRLMAHEDTTLWWVQAVTGFALFFLAAVHLYQMLMHPGDIGPYQSGERIWSGGWAPIYIVMLLAVELHGGIGLYRLCVKWGWFEGKDPNASRARLKVLKWVLTVFFLVLGIATFAAYAKIGYEMRDRRGEVYTPSWVVPNPMEKAK